MVDGDVVVSNSGRAVWFVAGGVMVAALIGLFLYTDGYFKSDSVDIKVGPESTVIEGQ